MSNRVLVSLIFFIFFQTASFSQDNSIRPRGYKNWFAGDAQIISGQVGIRDIENSPGNGDWLTFYGDYGANRFSLLKQINSDNVGKLVPKWIYQIGQGGYNLRSSPIVYKGTMYVTGSDEVHALDAYTGTWLWVWQAREQNIASNINKGVAILGERLFFSTGDCFLVALDRISGNLVWSRHFADPDEGNYSSVAPLVVGDKVIMGISNKNSSSRGFVAAFSTATGEELWRFWTIPEGSKFRGAPTWTVGSYDPVKNVLFWAVGVLEGNVVSESADIFDNTVVALNPDNGRLVWKTRLAERMPFDWDANEPLVLTEIQGKNVILLAHRNGLFYVIDRGNGEIIRSKPFVKKIDWLSADTCPSSWGATNWMSPSLNTATGLFYVMVLEGCRSDANVYHIKALDPVSGDVVWDYPTRGSNLVVPGIISTAGGIVFSAEGTGHIVALNSQNGTKMWDFSSGKRIFSSPVTYLSRNRQLISLVAGSDIITFGLPD